MNSRLDSIQAAILIEKLNVFEDELDRRTQIASSYNEILTSLCSSSGGELDLQLPYIRGYNGSAWAQYTVRIASRDSVREALHSQGIPTMIYYPMPLNLQPAVRNRSSVVPESVHAAQQVLSLPMHPYLETSVQKAIQRVLKGLENRESEAK